MVGFELVDESDGVYAWAEWGGFKSCGGGVWVGFFSFDFAFAFFLMWLVGWWWLGFDLDWAVRVLWFLANGVSDLGKVLRMKLLGL